METTIEKSDLRTRAGADSANPPFRPKDLLKQVVIQGLAVAPDGSSIVYARRTVEDNNYVRRLWRTTFKGGRPEQITTGKGSSRQPRFSPDGNSMLFMSDRSGKPQAWVMPLKGGEPRQLTDLASGAGGAEWSPDGKRVLLLAPCGEKRFLVGKPDDPIARRIRDYTWKINGAGYRDEFTSVWVIDAAGGKPARLTAPTYDVAGACWSPDGKHIAFLADLSEEARLLEYPALWSIPSRPSEEHPAQVASLPGAIFNAAWAPSRHLVFLGNSQPNQPGWANVDLYISDGKALRQLAAGRDLNIWNTTYGDFVDGEQMLSSPLCWLDRDHVVGLVAHRGACHPYVFGLDGTVDALAEADVVCNAVATGGGRVAVVASGDGPADVYAVEEGRLRPISADGSKWFGPFHRHVERVAVEHPDGHTIDTWLLPAHGARRRAPLVVAVHGGPNLSYGTTPWLEMSALAGAGFHVLWSNPRGSTGYGEAYARAIQGRWGDKDASDILRVLEWAVEQGLADPDRVGVVGLSYGGFMTTWLLGHHPGLFKAAVSENPVTDLLASFASADFGLVIGPDAVGADHPWDHLDEFLDRSPYTKIHRNEAPLLLLQAEQDLRCPPGQTEMVFTILRSLGREVEMVRYPDESHLLLVAGRPDRRVDRLERIVGWFQEHLGGAVEARAK
ncbi:MAG TPA: S9 family peptidase [Candidatus Dormibacteraeota bacterium]|nr:S9 family peptidase [Candidatus Dormibacteraeota bacterium]